MQLFHHLSDYALFSIILSAACFFQGVFGFGFVLLAMPLLIILGFQDKSIIAVFLCLSLYINLFSLWKYREHLNEGLQIKQLIFGAIIGVVPAYFMLNALKLDMFFWSMGILVFGLGLMQVSQINLPGRRHKDFDVFTGFSVSLIQTLFAMSGPILAFLLKQNHENPLKLKIKMILFNVVVNILSLCVFLHSSLITIHTLKATLYLLPPATFGLYVGFVIFKKINFDDFSKLLSYFMMMLGSLIFFRGFL